MILEIGKIIANRYKILEKIAVGGMAVVYRAEDMKLDRSVTFKVLKEEYVQDEDFIKRFNIEARAAARLNHPNIVNVYDVGNEGDIYYIVMEYIDGVTLKELIVKNAPFDDVEVLSISVQICSALENAHKNNIVHRDIKPQNIMVTKNGTIKVMDFGIARATTSQTVNAESIGSVHYFSPEQARGGFVDNRSDLYSLGIVMFEMVTNTLPFDGDSAVALAMKHIQEPLPDIRELNDNVSKSLEQIIVKLTQKSPANRYQSATELNQDFKKAMTDKSGEFIAKAEAVTNESTVVVGKEEVKQIRKLSKDFDKDKEKKVVVAGIITGLAIIILMTLFGIMYVNNSVNSYVNTPNFINKTYEEAEKLAKEKGVKISKDAEEYSADIEEGFVMAQDIEENREIRKGMTVGLTVSLGPETIEVFDVEGRELSEAYEIFGDHNFMIREEYEYNEDVAVGIVISQEPEAGTEIPENENVVLKVSMGAEKSVVVVPKLINKPEAEAKRIIESSDLTIGNIVYAESSTVEEGNVIRQGVNPGEEVSPKYVISLVVSTGKPQQAETQEAIENTTEQEFANPSEDVTEVENSEPQVKSDVLSISYPLDDTTQSVEVKIIKKSGSSAYEEIYVGQHTSADFPLNINVSGSEPTEYQLYIDGELKGSETKNFN